MISSLGLIFAPKSPRRVDPDAAREIVSVVRKYGERTSQLSLSEELKVLKQEDLSPKLWFTKTAAMLSKTTLRRPLVVGVFQDQSVDEINAAIDNCGLDVVQLHGEESMEMIDSIRAPCIKVVHVPREDSEQRSLLRSIRDRISLFSGRVVAIILDTSVRGDRSGGTGVTFDWKFAESLEVPVILAGGLTPSNVADALRVGGVVGLDVSSGVEASGQPGVKDHGLIRSFILKRTMG